MYKVESRVRVTITGKFITEVPDEIEFGSEEYYNYMESINNRSIDLDDLQLDPFGEDWWFEGDSVIE